MTIIRDKSTVGAIIVSYAQGKRDFKRNPAFDYKTRQFIADDLQQAYEIGFLTAKRLAKKEKQNA